ncbi:hypothetical protein JYU34_020576 [Plutella xylostella]|uniref:Glucosylceramidase n=1 Tax=Plutella xylostella TaxID=51655 RepID=A0ABQ7PW97_PLUXY|nr:hypothetical protein JYU34_020576 [Plutella xylostella]
MFKGKAAQDKPCKPRNYGHDSVACVCDKHYCDSANPQPPEYKSVILTVDRQKKGQTIIGFGTAFTDAAGLNLNSVSQNLRDQIINSYFGKEGLRYNMARTTIGHCDFSTEPYLP